MIVVFRIVENELHAVDGAGRDQVAKPPIFLVFGASSIFSAKCAGIGLAISSPDHVRIDPPTCMLSGSATLRCRVVER
ncbi:hypothetical protein NKG99_14375 [Mesorhizobium sp. M1409]|uniref:hypothetical protein n=1 Tax=unclassified Mesorhizobium TaxID=325217 RepID=UPI003339C272